MGFPRFRRGDIFVQQIPIAGRCLTNCALFDLAMLQTDRLAALLSDTIRTQERRNR